MGIKITAPRHENLCPGPHSLLCSWGLFVGFLLISCELGFFSLPSRSTLFTTLLFLFYPAFICIYGNIGICIRSEGILPKFEVHYVYSGFDWFNLGKKDLQCLKKTTTLNIKGLVQCFSTDKERRPWGTMGLFKVTHSLGTELHSPLSFLPSSFFFASPLFPFLLHFFPPWTVLY